jgi:predicted unusual protein kinase regulating ubiquinone biosynthesis (AarF/ABC1/UbiB family)
MGMLLPTAEGEPLERALAELFDRFGGMGFAELQRVDEREFRDFARRFGETMRSMPFQLPENLLLIIRAVSVTSGVCTALNPAFNIWTAIEPYAKRLTARGGTDAAREIVREVVATAGTIARLPRQLDEVITLLQRGRLSIELPGIDHRLHSLEKLIQRAVSAVVFASLLLGGIFLRQSDAVFGWVLIAGSVIPLLHAVFAGIGRRRER